MTALTAGNDSDAYCNKCKLVLAHVIIAMRGTKPARVECKTCNSTHAYKKDAPGAKKARKPTTRKSTSRTEASYHELIDGRDISQARGYKLSEHFDEEEVLLHKTFGIGVVTRVLSDNKISVSFQDGSKTLVHGR